jgi:hypothetical protein
MAKTYDFNKVMCTVGSVPMNGFIDGDAITIEMNNDEWELVMGCDGEGTRGKSNDLSGRITIRLMGSSSSNQILSSFRNIDNSTGLGQVPILIKDLFGLDQATVRAAWCVKAPPVNYGKTPGQREWVFESAKIELTLGGNF